VTQPSNIYCTEHLLNAGGSRSIQLGWQRASATIQLLCAGSVFALLALMGWRLWHGDFLVLSLSGFAALWVWYFHWHGAPVPDLLPSLLKLCRAEHGHCYIGGQQLPADLQQVVLGTTEHGHAYLQLAWNGGWQWLFNSQELPAVRAWLLQHYPALNFVS